MRHRNQAQIRRLKKMIDRGLSFTALAKQVGHDRSVVSKAIHHGRFPRVLLKIEEVLRA